MSLQFDTLEPATHAFSFWDGIPLHGRMAFGKLFKSSLSLTSVVVVQHAMYGEPSLIMAEMGFGLVLLMAQFEVAMSGSGAKFQVYIQESLYNIYNVPVVF